LLAAVSVASGVEPVVAGKPHQAMAELVAERVGRVDVMVGDRPSTDGLFARRLGARFVLVLSGVTTAADLPVEPSPDEVVASLADLAP
jgi:4-nitrophenyl phosphatase